MEKKQSITSDLLEIIWKKLSAPKMADKVNFFRLIAMTQTAGLWIRESLVALKKSEKSAPMRKILEWLIDQVTEWVSLADAMKEYNYFFSNQEIALVASSETMWNLPETLQSLADELENLQKIQWKIKSSMTYPTVILCLAIWAVIVLLVKVIPTVVTLFPDPATLPGITKFMIWLSDFIQKKWYLIIAVIVWIVWGYISLYRFVLPFKIFMDNFMLKAPVIWPINKTFNLYRFSKLLWDFYAAWVSPTSAVQQIADVMTNYHYKRKVLDVKKDLQVWLSFTESMEWSWLFPPILVQIITVWEKTWNMWMVLTKIWNYYREQINTTLEGLMKLIEPMLMAFIAVIVWTIVASVFLPMAELINVVWNQ